MRDSSGGSLMPIECVVLDFDGTFTDLAREAPGFEAAFPGLVADLLGRELGGAWEEAVAAVRAEAPELGWTVEGQAVAPADADPYILASCAAQKIFDRVGVLTREPGLRSDVITAIYKRAYRHTRAAFRPDAKAVFEQLCARGLPVYIVTNASTDAVERKLAELAPQGREAIQVRGDAAKFVIGAARERDERFERLPEARALPGLARPALLRRGRYFDVLAAMWRETGARPETTLVCGDIVELDLAMPAELGAHVHFITRPRTYPYELEMVRALGARGGVSDMLTPLLERIG
jgi:FMN phosphatase YigB (HAD superfamily)